MDDHAVGKRNVWWLAIVTEDGYCSYDELKKRKVIAQGWPSLGTLRELLPLVKRQEEEKFRKEVRAVFEKTHKNHLDGRDIKVSNIMWNLAALAPGDLVVAIEGKKVRGICMLEGFGYQAYRYQPQYGYAHGFGYETEWFDWNGDSEVSLPKRVASRTLGLSRVGVERDYVVSAWEQVTGVSLKVVEGNRNRYEEVEQRKISANSGITETTKQQLIDSRVGQGLFKKRLCDIEKGCRLTGTRNPNFLIASHIKPWAASNNTERLDGNNGFLMAPHVDKLFDRGWISFSNSGKVLFAADEDEVRRQMQEWGIDTSRRIGRFTAEQKGYLEYHRNRVFCRE